MGIVFSVLYFYFCSGINSIFMRLSELKTGEHAVIVKVMGYGGFRKRIIEMGFLPGERIDVVLNAPLKDPIKYKVMGYEVSLRRQEAAMIEVVEEENYVKGGKEGYDGMASIGEDEDTSRISARLHEIHVALVGNPNSGKTSLFNLASGAHEHVGNYGGVTVESKIGYFKHKDYKIKIVDLPGTYSLSAYSPEELYVRRHLVEETPDVVINVLDTTNIERNLYLTTQLIDMNIPIVAALNMYDEFEISGSSLDTGLLGTLLGIPMIPTVCKKKRGIDELFDKVVEIYEGKKDIGRHIHINHGSEIETGIGKLRRELIKNEVLKYKYHSRFLAIKLIESDADIVKIISAMPNAAEIMRIKEAVCKHIAEMLGEDSEAAVVNAKYAFIRGALLETYRESHRENRLKTKFIDSFVTHKFWGFPIFFFFMFVMFWTTFALGDYPMQWIEAFVDWLGGVLSESMPEGALRDMLVDGIIGGVGGVIVFLPNILILYFFMSFMEDSGYMSRAAFIMDKLMHKMGLHGKSFIPLVMGFGCNVPAIMSVRTIENSNNRLVTMLVNPFMSCSARLPVYIFFAGLFFPRHQTLVLFSIYILGIVLAVVLAKLFSRFLVAEDNTPFVMELPPYRMPTYKAVFRHSWEKGKHYLRKMGGIILVASIIVWALSYFPRKTEEMTELEHQETSYLGRFGKTVEPAIKPLGFDWRLGIGLLSGVGAKEIVLSTLCVLYPEDTAGETRIPISPPVAFGYMVFTLVYFPCLATLVAIKNESGAWKWAVFSAFFNTLLAWVLAFGVYQIGRLLGG